MTSKYKTLSIPILVIVFLLKSVFSCSVDRSLRQQRFASSRPVENTRIADGQYFEGTSSYYGKKFHGRKTASGETFNMYDLTAAHRSLPFGTILEIQNLSNDKKVVVRVNDRGPFVRDRILDLSYAAAEKIDMIQSGTAEIRAKVIHIP